jgi:hypothetical protein
MPSSGLWRRVRLLRIDVSEGSRFQHNPQGATSQKTALFILPIILFIGSDIIHTHKGYTEYPKLFPEYTRILLGKAAIT